MMTVIKEKSGAPSRRERNQQVRPFEKLDLSLVLCVQHTLQDCLQTLVTQIKLAAKQCNSTVVIGRPPRLTRCLQYPNLRFLLDTVLFIDSCW